MKKKNLLITLSIIEILSIILFIITFNVVLKKTVEIMVLGLTNQWTGSEELSLSTPEKIYVKINNISPYIAVISAVIRFIFIDRKCKIALAITPLIAFVSLKFLYWENSIMNILGIIFLIITIAIYIYSHKININDNSKIKDLFKKRTINKMVDEDK